MKLIGALTQAGAKSAKKTAPFYSAVDEALAAVKRPKGTGAEFFTELSKQPGVKKAELADRKLEQAFKAKGKITKEEAQQVLKDNPPPRLQEKTFTEPMDDYERDEALRDNMERFGYESWDEVPPRIMRQWNEELDENVEKYGDYKTAGGKNYREIILKLPASRPDPNNYRDPAQYDADLRSFNASGKADYQSPHWKEDPNVLAHMRVQDRKGPNGEKILHVEEIQSDWHQEGRKKGYRSDKPPFTVEADPYGVYRIKDANGQRFDPYVDGEQISGFMTAEAAENAMKGNMGKLPQSSGVPDAPFKKNWHELAMKRLLNYAADQGYDSIAITPGVEQAKRFNLRNQIDQIKYVQNQDGTYDLAVRPKGETRDTMFIGDKSLNGLPADKLESIVGREVTQKILAGEGPQGGDNFRSLTGVALEFGGEGMKGFYDKMLPDYLNTFGKPYGAQVMQIQAPIKYPLEGLRRMSGMKEDPPITLHNFPITPEMRESIKQKGLPLYQQIGIPTAGAGAASQMLEPEEESGLATGGIVKSGVKQAQLAKLAKMRQEMAPRAEAVKALIARDENRYLADVVPNSLTNAEIEAEIRRMAAKAPMIMKPSALTELRKIVQQEKGDYGSRRLERASDEIPNLEKLYNERALKDVFTGDNARALMTMNPADFEEYAARLSPRNISVPGFNGDKQRQSTEDYVKYLTSLDRFDDVPFLLINKEEQGLPLMPFISGHEGRHRNRSLVKRGEQAGLVQLLPRAELREPFPRRSQQEYIDAIRQELEMTGNKVKPESYFDDSLPKNLFIERPPIDLPDIYAKGGAVKHQVKKAVGGAINFDTAPDMSDQGRMIQGAPFKRGGKVNMTANRDTMFLELSNKKLKRK
jgi:hypothetical protein